MGFLFVTDMGPGVVWSYDTMGSCQYSLRDLREGCRMEDERDHEEIACVAGHKWREILMQGCSCVEGRVETSRHMD